MTTFARPHTFYWTPRRPSTRHSEGETRNKTHTDGSLGRHSDTNNPFAALTTMLSSTNRVTRRRATTLGYFRQKPVIASRTDHCGVLRRTTIIERGAV